MASGSFAKSRRDFMSMGGAAVVAAVLAGEPQASAAPKIRLGFDNFAVRDFKMKAPALLDYAASLKLDSILISDLDAYDSLEDDYLARIKEQGERLGLRVEAGSGSICPTSNSFNTRHGTAEEHARLLIRVANRIGSPVARCVLGNMGDRLTDGGIDRHIEETVKVCKAVRSYAIDMNVKLGIENHAGDMRAKELASLVEAAGRDFVGVNMDAGNAAWTLEDPLESLEILGPLAVVTSLRDSAIWEDESGAINVAWTAMGEGCVDWKRYVKRFGELCPGVSFNLETISGGPRKFDYVNDPNFWKAWPKVGIEEFAPFIALAKKGKPVAPPEAKDVPPEERNKTIQKNELERSLKYCKETLGLGLRGA